MTEFLQPNPPGLNVERVSVSKIAHYGVELSCPINWQIVSGYKLSMLYSAGKPGRLTDPTHEEIILTNRGFERVDKILHRLLSTGIQEQIAQGNVPVGILDVGGGWSGVAARGMVGKYGDSVSVTILDLLLPEDTGYFGRVKPVVGSATNMPIASESQAIVYSSYALQYVPDEDFETALREIVRVLKPGGKAFLHEEFYIQTLQAEKGEEELGNRLGVAVSIHEFSEATDEYLERQVLILSKPQD